MMNPQYMPPGQNNNAPNNPMNFPPTSQDYNGVQNANFQQPPNGSHDVSQKMQAMNLNGPAGYLPPGQLPPGAIPPTSFAPGQLPPGMNRGPGAPFPQMGPPPMPPSSAPGGQSQMQGPPKPSQPGLQGPAQNGQMPPVSQQQARSGIPPQSGLPQQPGMPPHPGQEPSRPMQSGQTPGFQPQAQPRPGQLPPHSQPGLPPHSQPGPVSSQQGMPPSSQPGQMSLPPQPQGQMPQSGQQGLHQQAQQSQPGFSSQSRPQQQPYPGQQQMPGQPPMPGQTPISSQSSMPRQAPILGQQQMSGPQGQLPGQPPMQQRQMPGQPPMPGQQGQMPSQQGPMPSQQGQMPSQQGPMPGLQGEMRGQQGQMPTQQGQMPGQPPMPVQQGQMPGQPPMPGQQGQIPGQPPMPGQQGQMPGQPPMPGQQGQMPGQPPMPGQQGQMPGQPPMPGQQGQMTNQPQYQMPGMPHMPPPLAQRQQFPGMPNQPGYGPPSGYQGQPPMPGQPSMPGQPPMHGQPPLPGQPPMSGQHIPGHPPMPGQQMPGQPPMPGQQMPGLPPMPGQQMPGQPPMPGQQMPGQPPMPYQQQQSGYPPQYGQQPPYPGQQPSYPGQQQKRLDPDQMPSPIQVMSDDQHNREGVFVTNEKGAVPPLVTTDFTVDDKGNASPRFIRSSMYSVPVTADLLKQTAMPFCLVISPMAEVLPGEQSPPLLDFAALTGSPTMGPVRCSRCKAYMCPNMKFIDAGRHFKCCFCKATTEVPMEYTQYVNSMQQYGRVPAEMALGAYELVATKEYCRNNTLPNAPAIVFILDVSYNSIKNGLLHTVCNNILDIIQSFPKDEQTGKCPTRVGIITYSSTVHFYNIKGTLAQPQMLSVGDVGDMFVPILEGFLVTAEDSGSVLPQLLQQLPQMFEGNKETETILLPAVQAGMEALKAADTSGQLLVFHTSLPSYNAPGKLINREDRKLLGTEKEKQILSPQTTAYNELGQSCSQAGVSVELFVCNNSYVDVATIGQLPRLTGGATHKYTYFTSELDGGRLVCDVRRVTSRGTAHDAVMRVRTSTGVRPTDFYGHMFMSNTSDVELAAVDADKAIAIEIKHDDKLTGEDGVYIQAALLYTHRSSQRRLRVLNLALNVAHQLADVYRCVELDTAVNFLTKQAVWALREHSPRQVREGLSSRCAKSLAAYRKHCASPSSAGQLVLPESMKLLPLYTSCILRSDAVAGGPDLTCDDRSCAMYRALTADVCMSVVYTYPRLLPLHRVGEVSPLPALRASVDKMRDHGVYLLENGVHMLLWVGSQASPDFVRDVFGVPSPQQIDTQVCELPELDNPASEAVRASVQHARTIRRNAMRLTIMRQHDKLEAVLRHFLVEDRGVDGSASYVDYLCHVHKEIRALL